MSVETLGPIQEDIFAAAARQHAWLAETLAQLREKLDPDGASDEETPLPGTFRTVIRVLIHHFDVEETLMRRLRYVDLDQHRLAHAHFLIEFGQIVAAIEADRSRERMRFGLAVLDRWFTSHHASYDAALDRYCSHFALDI